MGKLCDEVEKFGKGVGNPARYAILEALSLGPKTVGELVKVAKLSQPAVSQHLKTLKQCDLVASKKRGQEVEYSIKVEYMVSLLRNLVGVINRPKKT